ncbi:hypothetical protein [Leucobacter komagatae]|uniref:Uncharacterized protein n=1 Tax=Leucobacter komagatae TaxID=55969 RepID=A0A0D0IQR7_9MICO|nr:hypothetical protein [Leucobacter komagatae]KIP51848.1 hypothetical protein SD72_13020 [Leucobacter komagatae]
MGNANGKSKTDAKRAKALQQAKSRTVRERREGPLFKSDLVWVAACAALVVVIAFSIASIWWPCAQVALRIAAAVLLLLGSLGVLLEYKGIKELNRRQRIDMVLKLCVLVASYIAVLSTLLGGK